MNKQQLKNRLIAENIRPDAYCLDGGLPSEKLCFNEVNDKWEIYYSERGEKTGLKVFDNEEKACQYFYDELIDMVG